MGSVIGDVLPLAIGIAISPVPIMAAVLMLMSPRAKSTSLGFLVGWVLGITVAVVVFTLLSSVLPGQDSSGSAPVSGVIKIVLGVLLLLLSIKQWRGRPADGAEPELPKWMAAIDSMTTGKGLGLGFLLAAVNPKNLLFAISAAVIIGAAGLSLGQTIVVIVIFIMLAACTVIVPVVGYFVASDRMTGPLDRLRLWLADNNNAIMAVLLLVMGVSMIGKGIGDF
jgi:threonine/homoserine/homoserine lactone efflux protein